MYVWPGRDGTEYKPAIGAAVDIVTVDIIDSTSVHLKQNYHCMAFLTHRSLFFLATGAFIFQKNSAIIPGVPIQLTRLGLFTNS